MSFMNNILKALIFKLVILAILAVGEHVNNVRTFMAHSHIGVTDRKERNMCNMIKFYQQQSKNKTNNIELNNMWK